MEAVRRVWALTRLQEVKELIVRVYEVSGALGRLREVSELTLMVHECLEQLYEVSEMLEAA